MTASPTATKTPSPTATATSAPQVPATGFRATLLAGHNGVRSGVGVGNLTLSNALNQIAQERADTLARADAGDAMSHYNEDGTTVFDMMTASGHGWSDGAENIGYNFGYSAERSVEVVMQQWIDSPPHYANIVKGHLRKVGFGMAVSASGKVYYSAVFSD